MVPLEQFIGSLEAVIQQVKLELVIPLPLVQRLLLPIMQEIFKMVILATLVFLTRL